MPTLTLTLPRPHSAQKTVIHDARRFNVLACGRRWGKTRLGIDRLIRPALDGQPVAFFAPTYKMMSDVWRELYNTVQPVTQRVSSQEHRLELITGGIIDMWSLDTPDAPRGRKYQRVVIDEAAMVPHLQEAWQASIRPTLTDFEGDAWFTSTPKGMNFFRTVWQYGQDPARSEWASWQMPTTANPFIKASEVEAARQELPERTFAQEYLATFLEDAGGVYRGVRACATEPRREPYAGRFVMGVDWGQVNDFTVLVVMDSETRRVVDLDRFNQIGWSMQRGRLRAMAERWGVTAIIAESNSMGGPNVEALQDEGLPVTAFETTGVSKPPLIESLALAFERQEIRILDDPVLVGELEAYERDVSPVTGRSRYSAPEGMHDDCVMALALAWWGITNGRVGYGPSLWN
jgi:phage terminase large subunit-like protein